jgi:Tol biopolymer transport system component
MRRLSFVLLTIGILVSWGESASCQFGIPTGANHPELSWSQIETEHFIIIYHQGLDTIATHAASIAEEVYRVVTTNLQTPIARKTKIYISDNDEIKNAFAFSDDHIFLWLRGILDDLPYSIRSSGTSKWLRTVITHEFTHIVIAHATKSWFDFTGQFDDVPRWFNEGMARYMEPDGWTTDLDMVLRVATVSDDLNFDPEHYLSGTLLYEAGQSLVRYIATTYGDSSLRKIVKYRSDLFYDFNEAVKMVTKHSLKEIYKEWHKYLTVYYGTSYGQHHEVNEVGRRINCGLKIVNSARLAPDGKRIALIGKESTIAPTAIYLMHDDTSKAELLFTQIGIEPDFSWTSDGKSLIFSKLRIGTHSDFEYDLYKLNVETHDFTLLTTDGRYEYPDAANHSDRFVAVKVRDGGGDLDLCDGTGSVARHLTNFHDRQTQIYSPRWSPDDNSVAFSIFRANGQRDIAVVSVSDGAIRYLTNDSINDRYPVWSPKSDQVVFVTHLTGIPNLYKIPVGGVVSSRTPISDVASNIQAWDWSATKDSILVTSFDYQDEVTLYWYPTASLQSALPEPVQAGSKYGAWRSVRWPLVTRVEDSIPQVAFSTPTSYNSLLHIAPLAILPLLGSDRDRGSALGLRYGLGGVASDPMFKHNVTGFVDWGSTSNKLGYLVSYSNEQLGFSITATRADLLNFAGVFADSSLYLHSQSWGVTFGFAFPAPDDLAKTHLLTFGWERRTLEVWNRATFDSTPTNFKPIDALLQELSAKYVFNSENFLTSLSATHSDKKIGSDLTYTRLRFFTDLKFPFDITGDHSFAITGKAIAQEGDILPQEFVGFSPYDFFQGGFSIANSGGQDRLRGIRRYVYGNREAILSAELRNALSHGGPELVEFFDMGSAWYADVPTNEQGVEVTPLNKTHWLQTAGAELRIGMPGLFTVSGGVGWELVKYSHADWYVRVTGGI